MSIADVSDYLAGPFQQIEGWCDPFLWQAIEPIHVAQEALGVTGPVGEIGVHHGKFLIGLMKTKGAATGNLAIDVFDLQQFNLDNAGAGSIEVLCSNLARCGYGDDAVRIVRADSMALGTANIVDLRGGPEGGYLLFSVDGSHMVEHTVNDIRLAMELTAAQGVIMIDDFFAHDWPGVSEGIARLYINDTPRFVPLLAGYNKLFLCHISLHKHFLDALRDHVRAHLPTATAKAVMLFGHRMISIRPDRSTPQWTTLQATG